MSEWSTGGIDADGITQDGYFDCDQCEFYLQWPVAAGLPLSEDPDRAEMQAMASEHEASHVEPTAVDRGLVLTLEAWPTKVYLGSTKDKKWICVEGESGGFAVDLAHASEVAKKISQLAALVGHGTLIEDLRLPVVSLNELGHGLANMATAPLASSAQTFTEAGAA